jgi:hypothetical protein
MLPTNLKIWLAALAVLAALVILVFDPTVVQGSGLIVATLAAGAGWLFRDVNDEARKLRNLCQAYAALIETHLEGISESLSDEELARFLDLAPAIASGEAAEANSKRAADPYSTPPDIRDQVHLLSVETVRLLWKWRDRELDLYLVYDALGTKALSEIGRERLEAYFDKVKRYRDQYRETAHATLEQLAREVPGLRTTPAPAGAASDYVGQPSG